MFTGKRFRMRTSTIALDQVQGKRVTTTLPAGAVITIASGPSQGAQTLDVLFQGRRLVMFTVDVTERGEEITGRN
jgi:hypothetical protein